MNRKELEKIFEEKFRIIRFYDDCIMKDDIKDFIFDTVIKEVLRSVIPGEDWAWTLEDDRWYNEAIEDMEYNVLELYWINL